MKKRSWKKIVLRTLSVFVFLVVVLAVHIYFVTRHTPPGPNTRIMARIDIKQPITQTDAAKITTWLYQQKGVDRVLCNPASDIVVFTFYPVKTGANTVVNNFKSAFGYSNAVRIVPTEAQMESGCPVAGTSGTYKVYNFFKKLL